VSGNASQQDEDAARQLELATKILGLLYALISLAWLMWMLIPEHRKRLWAMRAVQAIRQATGTLAFRTGHKAMGHELASSTENYALPYLLSVARDKAAAVYERLRYTA